MAPQLPPALVEVLQAVAAEKRLEIAHGTHYDASDWELRWWSDGRLYRVNFQPGSGEKILVFHTVDSYPMLPRLSRWLRRWLPFFPPPRTTSQPCREFGPAVPIHEYAARVRELLSIGRC